MSSLYHTTSLAKCHYSHYFLMCGTGMTCVADLSIGPTHTQVFASRVWCVFCGGISFFPKLPNLELSA